MNKNEVIVGLIKGRHELPCEEYIFDEVKDVLDFSSMYKHIEEFVQNKVGIHTTTGMCINQQEATDVLKFVGDRTLVVYVTGLTPVTTCLVHVCALNGIRLVLKHFNRDTGDYVDQVMDFSN